MNVPILLAAEVLSEGSPVSITLAVLVGGSVVTLAVGLAETRFKTGAQDKRIGALEEAVHKAEEKAARALDDAKRDSERDRNEIRAKVQVMEVGAAETKVLMSEVRNQLTVQGEQNREQLRMLHDMMGMLGHNRRKSQGDAA